MAASKCSRFTNSVVPRHLCQALTLLASLACSVLLMVSLWASETVPSSPVISNVFQEFHNCVHPKLSPLKGNVEEFWYNFVNLTRHCDDLPGYKALDVRELRNNDEIKYVAYPRVAGNITMVTVGVGHDVKAEIKLKEIYPNTQFYGVDPSAEINKDLYEKELGGSFFPIALSGDGGLFESFVFRKTYDHEMIMHIGADYFFGRMLKKPKIDVLWIDNEGHEFTILELIHRNGPLDRSGVKICQLNVELHKETLAESHDEKQKFHDFFWKLLEDGKYVMLKPYFVTTGNKGFIRTFIVNVADKECTDSYLNYFF